MSTLDNLVGAANAAVAARNWEEAERLWGEVYKLDPKHPRALFGLTAHALQRGDLGQAHERLIEALAAAPQDLAVLQLAISIHEKRGDFTAEMEVIERALVVEPYFLSALLSKGSWMERQGRQREAASVYRNALAVAGPERSWPPANQVMLQHARDVATGQALQFHAFLKERLAERLGGIGGVERERWDEATAVMAGVSPVYPSVSNQLPVPRLPAIPFHDPSGFDWVEGLQAQTDVIREELAAAQEKLKDAFAPYIAYRPGDPVNQWAELNHSDRWSHLSLWRSGEAQAEVLAACPKTRAALETVDMADIGGLCPNVMFSALAPHTEIPPHHGETNARLVVHLPLIVPEGCSYRVGFEQRKWEEGKVLIFDDTIEHTARNDSDELRVVLIFDVWNPLLSIEERQVVRELAQAARAFANET